MWPTYRHRYLPAFTLRKIRSLPNKENALVVLPTGAIEQHGPQLPLGVDSILGQAYLDRALPQLPEETPVYVAPPIQIGKSNEHDGFPGTLMISRQTLRLQVLAVGRQIREWGFFRIAILNTHGGNLSVLKSALRELAMDYQLEVSFLSMPYERKLPEREQAFGIHANEVETSLMLEATPELVDTSKSVCWWIGSTDDPKQLKPEFAAATYAWKSLDISRSGVMGDASAGTPEKGKLWMERAARSLADELCRLTKTNPRIDPPASR